MRVIGDDGQQLGILGYQDALMKARERGLDLVLIVPNAKPPVAKILDFGKYRFEIQKKDKESKKKQKKTELKQMKFRPKIDGNDYQTKLRHVVRFLEDGHMVRVTVMFRGREMAFTEKGKDILDKILEDTKTKAKCTAKAKLEGRDMHMTLSPLAESERRKIEKELKEIEAAEQAAAEKKQDGAIAQQDA